MILVENIDYLCWRQKKMLGTDVVIAAGDSSESLFEEIFNNIDLVAVFLAKLLTEAKINVTIESNKPFVDRQPKKVIKVQVKAVKTILLDELNDIREKMKSVTGDQYTNSIQTEICEYTIVKCGNTVKLTIH